MTLEPLCAKSITKSQYLDTRNSECGLVDDGTGSGYISSVNAAFDAALMSPHASKNGTQDIWGNLKIPMLEAIVESNAANTNGWYNNPLKENMTYLSILGLPLVGASTDANGTFSVETSCFSLNWSAGLKPFNASSLVFPNDPSRGYVTNCEDIWIYFDSSHHVTSTEARRIYFNSFADSSTTAKLTEGWCNLTTTYGEAENLCNTTKSCAVQAVRKSTFDYPASVLSSLDGTAVDDEVALRFFAAFVNATTANSSSDESTTPTENYFVNPASFCSTTEAPFRADLGDDLFSRRFVQLLNTHWLVVENLS